MILTYNNFLFEKRTSLTQIDIPSEVIPQIEKDYEISPNAKWKRVNFREMMTINYIKEQTAKTNNLFIQINPNQIIIFTAINKGDKKVFLQDEYNYIEDDFGGFWKKDERTDLMMRNVGKENMFYLESTEFTLTPKKERILNKIEVQFDNINTQFKKDVLEHITKNEPDWYNKNGSMYDSLTNDLDRSIIEYEVKMAFKDRKKIFLLNDIIKTYGYDKVVRSFIYFIKTGKIQFTLKKYMNNV